MTPATDGLSRKTLAVVIAVVVVAASLTVVLTYADLGARDVSTLHTTESFSSSSSAGSSTYAGGPSATTYSTISASGLRLQVTLNSSSIQSHGEVAVQVELLNTLDRNVSLAVVANRNISGWNEADFFCSENPSHSLVDFAVFKGHLSAENVSAAGSPLQLAAPIAAGCPISLDLNDSTFLPNGDKTISFSYYGQTQEPSYPVTAEVNATTSYCVSSLSSISCPMSSGILGYWNAGFGYTGNMTYTSKDFTYLPPWEYTIVAMDDWGQTVYAYFQVTSQTGTTTSMSSSSIPSVSPSTTTIVNYGCSILGPSPPSTSSETSGTGTASSESSSSLSYPSSTVLVNTSAGSIELGVNVSPAAPLEATACSYAFTNTTTPIACGVMCGGGIGYTYNYSYVWKLNFSLGPGSNVVAGRNLTISQVGGLSRVFPDLANKVSLDSQQVTWYSNPACYGGDGIESDCMLDTATSITIELPNPTQNGAFHLVIRSFEILVP